MNAREAKDFLVQHTVEQAALDHVLFSDLERRMMYFTESGDCPEDPIALNDAFESECDNDKYEPKVSKLMHHAYQRIRKENPEAARQWKDAIGTLRKGDHYILVLWGQEPQERRSYDSLKLLLAGLLLAAIVTSVMFLANHYGIRWGKEPNTTSSRPPALGRVFFLLLSEQRKHIGPLLHSHQLLELLLIQNGDSQLLRLVVLRPRIRPDHHIIGLLAHRPAHLPAMLHHQRPRFLA